MKKAIIACLALLAIFSALSFSQVKYNSSGNFGIGTTTPRDVFHLYQSAPDIFYQCSSSYQTYMRFVESSTYYTGAYIKYDASPNELLFGIHSANTSSTSDDKNILVIDGIDGRIDFNPQSTAYFANTFVTNALSDYTKCYIVMRSGVTKFHVLGTGDVYVRGVWHASDLSLKEEIEPVINSAVMLNQLRPVKYKFKDGDSGVAQESNKFTYGLIAQEVEEVIPDIVGTNDDGLKAISYNDLIPLLIDAFQSQQLEVDDLKAQIASNPDLKKSADGLSSSNYGDELSQATLSQNIPNPFTENTIIRYSIPNVESYAMINVYDLSGNQVKCYNVAQTGDGEIMIPASELNPGLFIYNLIVDDVEVGAKRMILTEF